MITKNIISDVLNIQLTQKDILIFSVILFTILINFILVLSLKFDKTIFLLITVFSINLILTFLFDSKFKIKRNEFMIYKFFSISLFILIFTFYVSALFDLFFVKFYFFVKIVFVYVITAFFLSYILQNVIKSNIDFQYLVSATVITLTIHLILIFVFPDISYHIFRIFGFILDVYIILFFSKIQLFYIDVNTDLSIIDKNIIEIDALYLKYDVKEKTPDPKPDPKPDLIPEIKPFKLKIFKANILRPEKTPDLTPENKKDLKPISKADKPSILDDKIKADILRPEKSNKALNVISDETLKILDVQNNRPEKSFIEITPETKAKSKILKIISEMTADEGIKFKDKLVNFVNKDPKTTPDPKTLTHETKADLTPDLKRHYEVLKELNEKNFSKKSISKADKPSILDDKIKADILRPEKNKPETKPETKAKININKNNKKEKLKGNIKVK